MARHNDTIAALATPAGTAALATIRISGKDTNAIAGAVFRAAPPPRVATHLDYVDARGAFVDDVVATLYAGPASYTGEDSLEISCHGSPFIARKIVADLLARGCRPAAPGEFTQRAFLNGRMDLSQAEAVMEVISARSDRALEAAQRVLRGALGRHMGRLVDGVVAMLATVEAYIDFPDEDLPPENRALLETGVSDVLLETERLLATERTGALLREGIATVIVGEPNAGKSSLLNRIVGHERAIVSAEPGTTRDFIEERFNAGPHGLRLIDTAGLNPGAGGAERLGIQKTIERAEAADLFILVLDSTRAAPPIPAEIARRMNKSNTIVALNKSDLLGGGTPEATPLPGLPFVRVSALSGEGIEELLSGLERLAEGMQTTVGDEQIAINVRHAHYLEEARACLREALAKIRSHGPAELLASDLRGALGFLGEISGKVDNERMLDQLFAAFCIGK
jgi:tRNA modification GTPase